MAIDASFFKHVMFVDLDRELAVTRNVLQATPLGQFNWKPHERSMSLGRLAIHVADMPNWLRISLSEPGLDFATAERPPASMATTNELLRYFDKNVATLKEAVDRFDPATFAATWTMRQGEQVITSRPRDFVYRVWSINHLIHHRGQLGVYLRLLNVPVPTIYFNTADKPEMIFE